MSLYETPESSLTYLVRDQWHSGFVADLELSVADVRNGWRIEFELDAEITDIWNARIVSREGNRYVIEGMSYNSELPAGGKAGFGFVAAGTATDLSGTVLNGQATGDDNGGTEPAPLPMVALGEPFPVEEGATLATIPVTLSAVGDQDVLVTFETYLPATAGGMETVLASGQLLIPAGQAGGLIELSLEGLDLPEGVAGFELRLTSAEGAVLDDAGGTVQVPMPPEPADPAPGDPGPGDPGPGDPGPGDPGPGDPGPGDPGPLPQVSVSDINVGEPPAGPGQGGTGIIAPGPLSTAGNQILDSTGAAVEIRAVNWFGLETQTHTPHGLWTRNWQDMMDQMLDLGFNTIRLPFSGELVLQAPEPNSINYALNPDLVGLNGLQIMDKVIDYAGEIGLRVLLDHHRSEAGDGANEHGLWTTGSYSEADWIGVWEGLAARYQGNDTVIGADLHNEPHGPATWGDGGPTDWARAATAAGNAIHEVNPDWLIVVEGIGGYQGENYWWGGALQGVRDTPIELALDGKLVYSPHDYPASVYAQPWFFDGSDLFEVFRNAWGFIYEEGIAPILVGEFGSRLETAVDQAWADAIIAYLGGDLNGDGQVDIPEGDGGMSFAWWSWNPNSGDTGGILENDWTTVRQNAIELLQPLLQEPAGEPSGPGAEPLMAVFTIVLDAPADGELVLTYTTEDGTAIAWQDYVPESGTLVFAPGEQEKTVAIQIQPDRDPADGLTFELVLDGPVEGDLRAVATITDGQAPPVGEPGDGEPVDPNPGDPGPGDPGPGDPGPGDPGPGDEIADLLAEFVVRTDWGSGATVDLNLTNAGSEAVNGWQLSFDLPVEIQHLWNAEIAGAENSRYALSNADWNGGIAPGQTVTLGFNTSGGGLDPVSLNEQANFAYLMF